MGETPKSARKPIVERLESPIHQQSQESYLVPRNCWLHITGLKLKPTSFEKNQKLRIKISVPNSGRVMKTSSVTIDDSMLQYFEEVQKTHDMAEINMDVTAVSEYRHDARFYHPSNLEFELELTSAILSMTKVIASGSYDMSDVIQRPYSGLLLLKKDSLVVGALSIQIHSLCMNVHDPLTKQESTTFVLSDSDSELMNTPIQQNSYNYTQILRSNKAVVVDSTTPQGRIVLQGLRQLDMIVPISEQSQIQNLFDNIAQSGPKEDPTRILIIGNDYFVSRVLTAFLFMRDRGLLSNGQIDFLTVPLSIDHSYISQFLCAKSSSYANTFLSPAWMTQFSPDSSVQSPSNLIQNNIDWIMKSNLDVGHLLIADILITTHDSQFVVPMLRNLEVGDSSRFLPGNVRSTSHLISLKGTFVGAKSKTLVVKFHHMCAHIHNDMILTHWREISNSNIIPVLQSLDKFNIEEKKRSSKKTSFSVSKGQTPVDIRIDSIVYKRVTDFTITIRDPEASLRVCLPN